MKQADEKPVVLLTGGGSGLGQILVQQFLKGGFRVCATIRNEEPELESKDLMYLKVDMKDHAALPGTIDQVINHFSRIDALICNAAVQGFGHIADVSKDDWQDTLDVNLTAPFLLAQAAAPHLEKTSGLIVFISSVHGVLAAPSRTMYAVTKAGLIAMARNLAVDLAAEKIRVLSLILGPFKSPALAEGTARFFPGQSADEAVESFSQLQPLGRVGSGEELGDVIKFLMSDAASFISGTSLTIDGGQSSRLAIPEITEQF